jgi:hypothetical protein
MDKVAARAQLTEQGVDVITRLSYFFKQYGWEADHANVNDALRREHFTWIKRFVNQQQDMSNFEDSWNDMGDHRRIQMALKYSINPADLNVMSLVYDANQAEFQKEKKAVYAETGRADSIVSKFLHGGLGNNLTHVILNPDNMMYVLRVSNMIMKWASEEKAMDKKLVVQELLKIAKDLMATSDIEVIKRR